MLLTWTLENSALQNNWINVCYGNGLFVAVSSDGNIMTSTNGTTWTQQTTPETSSWVNVCFGNGYFVAVASGGTNRVMVSSNGINWATKSCPSNIWLGVTYGNGTFVAVGGFPSCAMTSVDNGETWVSQTTTGENAFSVAYGNGLFVAVASYSSGIMTSPDGVTWTSVVSPDANMTWRSVCYGNGTFVAVSGSTPNNKVMTSSDGTNWTTYVSGADVSWGSITYADNLFVAVSNSTNNVMTSSSNGVTWQSQTGAITTGVSGVAFGNSLFVAVSGAASIQQVMISNPVCFNEGTKILCLNRNFEEVYLPIETLQKGDIVKTYKHGYRKIKLIAHGSFINNVDCFKTCMYRIKKTESNKLIEDLVVTGGHSILVDSLGEKEEENKKYFNGETLTIDDKVLLLAPLVEDSEKITRNEKFTYYHFVLENDGDNEQRFGVYANGILTETPSFNFFSQSYF